MTAFLYIFLKDEKFPVLVTGGKVSFKKARKVIKEGLPPNEHIEKIQFKDQVITTRDITMITIHDPGKTPKIKNATRVDLHFGSVEDIPIKYDEFKKQFEFKKPHPHNVYETRFIENNWTLVRKGRVKGFEKI